MNNRMRMFSVAGAHTFFMPVDTAFDTSVQLSGYVQLICHNELSITFHKNSLHVSSKFLFSKGTTMTNIIEDFLRESNRL